ncbi:MAG: SPOR domain-containing protein [Zoogloeaceae bacterium]|nr:SPOR domain-containing protein [Zoogloeaceae bacterium]
MRFLVFFLVVANLLLFAYAQDYLGARVSPDRERLQAQLNSGEIRVLARRKPPMTELLKGSPDTGNGPDAGSASETPTPVVPPAGASPSSTVHSPAVAPPPALPAVSANAAPPPVASAAPQGSAAPPAVVPTPVSGKTACLLFSTPSPEVAEQIGAQASRVGLRITVRSEGAWWVFIPPLSDRQAAVRKVGELKNLGVAESFIINDGPQRFAISLGVFSRAETAQAYLARLREKGVRSAQAGPRLTEKSHQLEVRGDALALVPLRLNQPAGVTSQDCP